MTMILTSMAMVGWADVSDSDRDDFRCQRAINISGFFPRLGLRSKPASLYKVPELPLNSGKSERILLRTGLSIEVVWPGHGRNLTYENSQHVDWGNLIWAEWEWQPILMEVPCRGLGNLSGIFQRFSSGHDNFVDGMSTLGPVVAGRPQNGNYTFRAHIS